MLAVKNVMSVDVEDYFHAESLAGVLQRSAWDSLPTRVEANTKRLLDLFAAHQVQATFFVLGWVADRYPKLVRAIADGGHELACHSYWHRLIYNLNANEFREDTRRAKQAIEQASGQPVAGYRAPTYSITLESLWAFDVLAELGFAYDSSIFPIHHDRYGIPQSPRFPFRIQTPAGQLLEYPLTTFRLASYNFPVAGGGYLRLLPWLYTSFGIRRTIKDALPIICYIHPWEIDPEQPRAAVRLSTRLRHYTNLSKAYGRIEHMIEKHSFTSFRDSGLAAVAHTEDIQRWNRNGRKQETNGNRQR